jgi:hypothetical protein
MLIISDITKMIGDIGAANEKVNIWGGALNLPQIIGGLIFIYTIEGQLIFALEIIALIIASQIHKRFRFSRLMGLCHIPWLVLAPWLLYRTQTIEYQIFFLVWLYYVIITMFISIIFDVLDVYQYTKGNKTFTWGA